VGRTRRRRVAASAFEFFAWLANALDQRHIPCLHAAALNLCCAIALLLFKKQTQILLNHLAAWNEMQLSPSKVSIGRISHAKCYTADGYVSGSSPVCHCEVRSSGSTARVWSK